ncbi:MAG: AMP-binding protein, partial [Candidatus Brocadiia bacterium]|nr:AMP-binding protein [Candidatus Brocadiia bacterium]
LPSLLAAGEVIRHGGPATAVETDGWVSWEALCAAGDPSFVSPFEIGPSDLATILFTSGTTGFPKGCMLSHDYWLVLGQVQAAQTEDLAPRNFLIWMPFFYMGGLMEMMLTLSSDGTAHVVRRMSASHFMDWLREYRIHYCYMPLYVMKQHPPSAADAECQLKFVQAYFYKGERHHELCDRFGVVGFDGYGSSEQGMALILPASARHMIGTGSLGVPAPYREVKLVDEAGAEVPRGEVGELWSTGRGIVSGYYKRPQANAESFSGKWFRSGDLIRQDADGYYYFVGRLKDMIKRSGENVSAREVETVLVDHPDVVRAAVVPVPDDRRGEEVMAHVQLAEGRGPADTTPERIFAHCRESLASFKVPRYLAYVDAFPLNDSGRVRKSALIAPSGGDMRKGAFDRIDGLWR